MMLLWIFLVLLIGGTVAWLAELGGRDWPRWVSLVVLAVDLALVLVLWSKNYEAISIAPQGTWIAELDLPWIPTLGIHFHLGLDGLSLLLILLTIGLGIMSVAASWSEITEDIGFFHFNLLWPHAGTVGVIKHIPGHGRALVDSHKELPVVDASEEELAIDLEPFERLNWAPMAMVAHVIYTAWDKHLPASLSPTVIDEIIRGRIGFDGFLMSDDIGMEALSGDPGTRASGVVAAGCDVALHCSGKMDEMISVANAVPAMSDAAVERLLQAMVIAKGESGGPNFETEIARRDELLALA